MEPVKTASSSTDARRRDLVRYLTADESDDCLAVMDLSAETLLTDLSAADVAGRLADRGRIVERDVVEWLISGTANGGSYLRSTPQPTTAKICS